jgi:hypothetical protein
MENCIEMKDPPVIDFRLVDIEGEENRFSETLDSSDIETEMECSGERCFTPPDDDWEIINRGSDFIIHGLETLDEQLDIIATRIDTENKTEEILKNIRKGFSIIDDIILYATTFINEASKAKVEKFRGFISDLLDFAKTNITKTLVIIRKLRARSLLSLIPLTKDLVVEQKHIKKLVSSSNLEQIKELLKEYRHTIRRRVSRRYSI